MVFPFRVSKGNVMHLNVLWVTLYMQLTLFDLRQIDCQLFLQQRWVYSRSAENYSRGLQPWQATCKCLHRQGKENFFIEEKRKPQQDNLSDKDYTGGSPKSICNPRCQHPPTKRHTDSSPKRRHIAYLNVYRKTKSLQRSYMFQF